MIDENIRRLLHYSKSERERSFQREGVLNPEEEEIIRHFAILPDWITPKINHLTEISLRDLGVNVIWISDFAEIPDHLKNLYNSTGDQWDDVF